MSVEIFFQFEDEAQARAVALRDEGFDVTITAFEGGHSLDVEGPAGGMQKLARAVHLEQAARSGHVLTGAVLWWRDEKGYGRITGDDGYVYFCHFSALEMDGYKTLREGQRVEMIVGGLADHGRLAVTSVRPIP